MSPTVFAVAAVGAAQEYSAVVVDNTAGEAGKDRGEGDSALKLRDVPTGGGCRPTTTVRSDFGADRTACDAARGMSIRLRSPVGQKYEAVLGGSDGECMACWQKITPKLTLRRGRRASGRPLESDPRREKQHANWNSAQLSASIEELSLGACPGDAQMGNTG